MAGKREARDPSPPKHWAYVKPVKPVPPPSSTQRWYESDRQLHPGASGTGRPDLFARSVEREAGTARVSGSDRFAADPAEVDAFLADTQPRCLRASGGPAAGFAALRRALGASRGSTWPVTRTPTVTKRTPPRSIWPYRDWVIRALNRDMPFDQFTIEQIAGDMLPKATEDQQIATGFHRNTMFNAEGGVDRRRVSLESKWTGSTPPPPSGSAPPWLARNATTTNTIRSPRGSIYQSWPSSTMRTSVWRITARRQSTSSLCSRCPRPSRKRTAKGSMRESRNWPGKPRPDAGTESGADGVGKIGAGCGAGLARHHSREDDHRRGNHTDCRCAGADLRRGRSAAQRSLHGRVQAPVDRGQGHPPGGGTQLKAAARRPGADAYGNFIVTQIKLEIPDGTGWKAVAIQKIATDTGARWLNRKRGQLWTVDARARTSGCPAIGDRAGRSDYRAGGAHHGRAGIGIQLPERRLLPAFRHGRLEPCNGGRRQPFSARSARQNRPN